MPSVADCLRQHGAEYVGKFGDRLPRRQRQVLDAITRCRQGGFGWLMYACRSCRRRHWVGRSCGNRHCPTCQHEKTQQWLAQQTSRLLPVHHFLVTFTVPKDVQRVLRSHPKAGYDALLAAARDTLRLRGGRSKYLTGCTLGFFGVLHTWGRDPLVYHPHVHFVVPGGGVSADGSAWQSTPENFLFPHKPMPDEFKTFFEAAMQEAGLHGKVPAEAWDKKWVVDLKPVGHGEAVLKYLAPYVYRVAISDNRITACDEHCVTYRYLPSDSKRWKKRTVTGEQFVRGFLQHTLPRGFQKVRHYGWMSSNSRVSLDLVRWLVWLFLGWTYWLGSGHAPPPAKREVGSPRCANCGGAMTLEAIMLPDAGLLLLATSTLRTTHTLPLHARKYLDSG